MKAFRTIVWTVLVGTAVCTAAARAVDRAALKALSNRYPFAILVEPVGNHPLRFIYADETQHIHVYKNLEGRLELDWEETNLASRVVSMFVTDLHGDGRDQLVVATAAGRILHYDLDTYDLIWENLEDPFEDISYMIADNLDDDPQDELVFISGEILFIYDSLNHTIEWESQDKFQATQMLFGNVDDDEQPEIILNTGTVIDSRFYNIEFQAEKPFGDRIQLTDINGDGIPEVFGEFHDFNLRIFDLYAEREIW